MGRGRHGSAQSDGFRPKPMNTLKASLYSLMPPGSTIIVPDSLWNSPFWGGLLVGAALRDAYNLVAQPYWDSLSEEERQRAIYYLTVGSQNQD